MFSALRSFSAEWMPRNGLFETVAEEIFLWSKGLRQFEPKIKIDVVCGDFRIRTANDYEDIKKLVKFRHEIFFGSAATSKVLDLDADKYDLIADHLIIEDLVTHETLGTYRLISSDFSLMFYSESEFNLDSFKFSDGSKLELGRACVAPRLRNGVGIGLLWRGVAEYIKNTKPRYLFGCASLATLDPQAVLIIQSYLLANHRSSRFRVMPIGKFLNKSTADVIPDEVPAEHRTKPPANFEYASQTDGLWKNIEVPPLLQSYLRMGAKVAGPAAFDKSFGCVDFLTILDLTKLDRAFGRRFLGIR
ncbi:MAG: hypothetical protein COT74_11795 [Bdellovibrionales bacterium CG10_big_fil_rev_8_21_14_0_10_45_34]|nr:MAG: hypothetical protein COT74_11795 [Bdellovibrionales bacterium CG10_big_fil_rev_8_21_14_0_10_45_34]